MMRRVTTFVFLLVVSPLVLAGEPFRYPGGKHGKGELTYRSGLPVLVVAGTPEEMGEQIGVLAVKQVPQALSLIEDFLKGLGLQKAYPYLLKSGRGFLPRFPEHHRRELEMIAKASGLEFDLLVFMNTFPDMVKFAGCSTLVVQPERSATTGPLFGRNLDLPPIGRLHEYSIVTVYRPKGKRAFVSMGFPGLVGVGSGMNDAGLALAANEITSAKDGSPRFDAKGVPLGLALRRVLEECATIEEAEKLLRSIPRTTMVSLTVCDQKGGAVFEVTPKNLVVRRPLDGVCACTNHFRTDALATSTECRRYAVLEKSQAPGRLGLTEVAAQLHAVNQGPMTMQTMIFEPAALRIHLAIGKGPTSALPLKALELGPLFKASNGAAAKR